MLLGTLSGSLLGNMLVGKGAIATRNVILRVSLGMGVTDRGQKRVINSAPIKLKLRTWEFFEVGNSMKLIIFDEIENSLIYEQFLSF